MRALRMRENVEACLRETLTVAVALGVASGCVEVALRAEPRLGLSSAELLIWLALAVLCGLAIALPAAAVASAIGRRQAGLVVAALAAVHGALWYRFEVVLNEFVRDPRVWGGLLAIGAGSLVIGLALDGLARKAVKPAWAVAALAALAALVIGRAPGAVEGAAGGAAPNVLLITLDTTRPDRLGPYSGPAETPTLDRLAAEGVTFTQAVAPAPLTEPSHLSLMTGKPTFATGVVSNGTSFEGQPIAGEMLQSRMKAAGWRTGGFVSGFPLHGKWGWLRDFDVYDDDFGEIPGMHRLSLVRLYEQLFLPGNTLRERYGEFTADRAGRFLARDIDGPWFTWVHLFDPHGPYEVDDATLAGAPREGAALDLPAYWPPPYRTITDADWLIRSYDIEIEKADRLVGELVAQIEAAGALDDTVVIVTADHGESLLEHGYLFDHGDYLYDASLRIPLIVRWPDRARAGLRVDCQVSTTDLVPTLVDWLGLPLGGELGRTLAGAMAGDDCATQPAISSAVGGKFMEDPPIDFSIRTPRSKFIRHGDSSVRAELYDLEGDPGETRNLIVARAAEAELAGSQLEAIMEGNAVATTGPDTSAETMEALRSLGYIE